MGLGSGPACDLTLNSILPPELREKYQNPAVIRKVLAESRTIAIVGLSTDRQKASHFVATYLKYAGYRIIPVHPRAKEILGERAYPDLLSIPEPVDVVDVFRPAHECPEYARQAVEIGAKTLWLQLRIVSLEAAQIAEAGGLQVVMDRCIKMEHGRYNGSMHWVGMNTGIITARRARRWF
ncbi:CoA-binding protein [Rhodothermus marinus]|uniref:CoA-binding protein n=1 Tax=Rhodothermus marinus TaxID=29549 RepID=UPI000B03CD08|nr:CoA-binding protein [Rhodothermus marinus]